MAALVRVRPAHVLIDWGPVIAGALIALALSALFAIVGVAIGATAFNPFRPDPEGLSIGGGLWTAFSALVALQIGGFVATRASPLDDGHGGLIQGATTWALFIVVGLILTGFGASLGVAALFRPEALVDARLAAIEDPAAAEAMADRIAAIAWWGALTMALSLVGAIAGGMLGEQPTFWEEWRDYVAARAQATPPSAIPPAPAATQPPPATPT